MADPDMKSFLQRIAKMSDADISILEGSLGMPDSVMSTASGSANDLLWSDMVNVGWMSKRTETPKIEGCPPATFLIYKIEQFGIEPIKGLLNTRRRGRKMIAIYNELYPKVIPQIVEPIRASGGAHEDYLTILAYITAELVHYAFKPEFREEALEKIFYAAKIRLKQRNDSL